MKLTAMEADSLARDIVNSLFESMDGRGTRLAILDERGVKARDLGGWGYEPAVQQVLKILKRTEVVGEPVAVTLEERESRLADWLVGLDRDDWLVAVRWMAPTMCKDNPRLLVDIVARAEGKHGPLSSLFAELGLKVEVA